MNHMFGQVYNNPMMFSAGGFGMTSLNMNCMDPYGSQALGYNLAMTGVGMLGMILNGSFGSSSAIHGNYDGRGTSSKLTLDQQIEKIENKIDAIDTKLESPEKLIDKSYQAKIDKNEARADALPKELNTANSELETAEAKAKKRLTTTKDGSEVPPTDDEIAADPAVKAAKAKVKKLEQELEKINGDETVEGSTKYYEKLKNDAIEEAKATLAAEKADLEEQLENLQTKQSNNELSELLNEADGNIFSRMKNSDKAKAQSALHKFRKAQEKWAKGDHSKEVREQLQTAMKSLNEMGYDGDENITKITKTAKTWYEDNKTEIEKQ